MNLDKRYFNKIHTQLIVNHTHVQTAILAVVFNQSCKSYTSIKNGEANLFDYYLNWICVYTQAIVTCVPVHVHMY